MTRPVTGALELRVLELALQHAEQIRFVGERRRQIDAKKEPRLARRIDAAQPRHRCVVRSEELDAVRSFASPFEPRRKARHHAAQGKEKRLDR